MLKNIIYFILYMTSLVAFADKLPNIDEINNFSVNDYLRTLGEQDADAIRLDSLGYTAYLENDLLKAAKLWWCAIQKNPNHTWAHYNYACTLTLFASYFNRDPATIIMDLEYSEETVLLFKYIDLVFYHLKKAISLDSTVWNRMQEDSDLDLIRNMLEYKLMFFYPQNNPIKILNLVGTFYGRSPGAYPAGYVEFDGNRITINDVTSDENLQYTQVTRTGYFTVSGNRLNITLETPGRETLQGNINLKKDDFGYVIFIIIGIEEKSYYITPDYSA